MNWLDSLKIALLEQNTQRAYELVVNIPKDSFKDMEELLVAQELISQTIEMLEGDQENLKKQMLQVKMAKKFLE
ncbi:hypothetical protein [Helicobacter cappadocius]|uniref:Uncharacterized protein n=1 Tax=Helicobacter cappadocius TaxID=3063998 RepID=A0AA90PZF1_9HELI|nr:MULTISPECIES: hypothetical protein [unclassified Helicobacter]MDO7253378.1 hypothetical protein [Helicobacter sp. faydin-H75]MDP2539358.1 hypothetical protein [Helicobacter sp. faydin-H76]